ncbi:MAG: heat shock protein transcriptional repressor HspR [Streptomycetales bacterium]
MSGVNPFDWNDEHPVYVISIAAQLCGLHAQTLRQYDRLGLVSPGRAAGGGRRYSARDIRMLGEVQRLSQDGISLAGIKRILELETQVAMLQQRIAELEIDVDAALASAQRREADIHASYRRDLVPLSDSMPRSTALVVWRPQRRRR